MFASEHRLQFALLSDHDGRVSEAYGVLQDSFDGHPRVAAPAVFVVAPDRTVRYVWEGEGTGAEPDLDSLRTAATDTVSASTPRD